MQLLMETGFLGFGHGRPWSMPMWLVSSGEGLMCTNLRSKLQVAWLLILDIVGSHGGYMMS